MLEDLEIAKKKIQDCISVISQKKWSIFTAASSEVFVIEIEKILKELKLFQNNINSTHSNFINEITPIEKYYSKNYTDSYVNELENIGINFKPINEYNYILNERIESLKIMRFDNKFESDIVYYKYLNECFIEINKLRLDFMRFYRSLKNKYKDSNKIDDNQNNAESDFYHFITDKKKELERNIKLVESKFNLINSNYSALDNIINNLDKNYTNQVEKVNTLGGDLNVLEKRLYELEISVTKALDTIQAESALNLVNIEKELILDAQDKLLRFTEGFDQTEKLINSEFEDVKRTTKKFNEFIGEETSIKLTNNFKDKAAIERNWYYGFNGASVIIIIIAIVMSYTSLTNFADNHAKDFTQLDLYYLAIRLLFSFLIFSTVAFTNKLANKHYYHWKKNESTYLKLTALKSFIVDMSPEKQQEIHEKLIDVYFGKEDLDPTIYKKYDNSSENILKLFADKLPSIGTETKKGS